jgi:hypothetical protein
MLEAAIGHARHGDEKLALQGVCRFGSGHPHLTAPLTLAAVANQHNAIMP